MLLGTMGNGRFAGLAVGWAVAALLLVGCGTSSPAAPSALDPATLAPASTLIYVSVTVRPQGSLAAQMRQTLAKLGGSGAAHAIVRAINRSLAKDGMSYRANIRPWLGQRVGLVLTELPQTGVPSRSIPPGMALIMPTKNPSAARAFVRRLMSRNPGTYGRVSGGYAVYGGALAYQQTLGLPRADSLAASSAYRTTTSELGSGTAATVFVNLHRFAQMTAAKSSAASGLGALLQRSLARIRPNAALAAGVTMSPSAIRVDTVSSGVGQSARHPAADVGALPSGSWLALTTGSLGASTQKELRAGFQLGLLGSLSRGGLSGSPLAAAMTRRLAFLEQDVLPALGPMSLAVGGTSPLNLTAGLKLTPSSLLAATRLLGLLHGLAARSPALSVSGKASHFSVKVPTGSSLMVNEIHRAVVATYGFATPSAFLSPVSKLAEDPTYRAALSELPSGSSVPFYLSFGPLAALVELADHQPSAAKTIQVLDRLSYLIVGGVPGHTRMVLGLR
jgi:hypothetical protein